ncbi:MAG: BTAD domain-containing putative transcriptional regulator, partial [Thermoplasmatota archaeon]
MNVAAHRDPPAARSAVSTANTTHGAARNGTDPAFEAAAVRELTRRGLSEAAAKHLARRYGTNAYAVAAYAERDRLRTLAAKGLKAAAALRVERDDLGAAAGHLERLTDLEPYDVDVHREIITLCLVRGRRSEALRRYAALRIRVLRTFGEDIDFALSDLREGAANGAGEPAAQRPPPQRIVRPPVRPRAQRPVSPVSRPLPDGKVLAALAGLAVICTALAFLVFFALIREVGPSRALVFT